jgi:hypothetical protein
MMDEKARAKIEKLELRIIEIEKQLWTFMDKVNGQILNIKDLHPRNNDERGH